MMSKIVNDLRLAACYHLLFKRKSRNIKYLVLIPPRLERAKSSAASAPGYSDILSIPSF